MAGSRTLKLSILADTADLVKGLKNAEDTSSTFGDKLGGAFKAVGVAAAAAGAAIGAMAIKAAVDGVKSAIEDEAAQAKLAKTLQNVTDATDLQIASVEKYIYQTSLATGITDDQLRPSFDRLLRSTQSVTEATRLQSLAIEIAAGTGKGLSQVTEALSKAYDGSFGALKKLGVPLDENIIKTKDFDAAVVVLSQTFAGQADVAANTFAGRLARMKVASDEAKETLGFALLPVLERLAGFMTNSAIPTLNSFIAGLTGEKGLSVATEYAGKRVDSFEPKVTSLEKAATIAGITIRELGSRIGKLFADVDELTGGKGSALDGFVKIINVITAAASACTTAVQALVGALASMKKFFENPIQFQSGWTKFLEFLVTLRKALVGDFTAPSIPPQFSARRSGFDTSVPMAPTVPQIYTAGFSGGGMVNNITVNGAIDSESTARQIVSILNDSQARGTLGGAGILV